MVHLTTSSSYFGPRLSIIRFDGYLWMRALERQPRNLLQLLNRLVRPPQMHLDRVESLSARLLEVLANVVQENNVLWRDALLPAFAPMPWIMRILLGKSVELLQSEPVDFGIGLAYANVRRRYEEIKDLPNGLVEEVVPVQLVAPREDDRVAQRGQDIPAAGPELLQGRIHPGVGRVRAGHHLVEEPLAVDARKRRNLVPGQARVLCLLRRVKVLPELLHVEVSREALEEGVVHGDLASFDALPEACGTGLGDGVVYPAGRDS